MREFIGETWFFVDASKELVQGIATKSNYYRKCPVEAYKEIAGYIEENWRNERIRVKGITKACNLPCCQVSAAIAFMIERSVLYKKGKSIYVNSEFVYFDAMVEYEFLREKGSREDAD